MVNDSTHSSTRGTINSRKLLKKAGDVLGVSTEEVPRTVKKLLQETSKLDGKIKDLENGL